MSPMKAWVVTKYYVNMNVAYNIIIMSPVKALVVTKSHKNTNVAVNIICRQ